MRVKAELLLVFLAVAFGGCPRKQAPASDGVPSAGSVELPTPELRSVKLVGRVLRPGSMLYRTRTTRLISVKK
jgi:hypothetical protein